METYKPTVFIIDDNPAICQSTQHLVESIHLQADTYLDPQTFLKQFNPKSCGCILSDIRMRGLSGLTLQAEIRNRGSEIPFVFMSGHSDVSVATEAMKAGAVDFLVKPVHSQKLIDTLQKAIAMDEIRFHEAVQQHLLTTKVKLLTPREKQIMFEVADGKLNKLIAADLSLSQKTVELHRSNMMKKLGLKSLPELVRLVDQLPESIEN